jgi:hypothetical protein
MDLLRQKIYTNTNFDNNNVDIYDDHILKIEAVFEAGDELIPYGIFESAIANKNTWLIKKLMVYPNVEDGPDYCAIDEAVLMAFTDDKLEILKLLLTAPNATVYVLSDAMYEMMLTDEVDMIKYIINHTDYNFHNDDVSTALLNHREIGSDEMKLLLLTIPHYDYSCIIQDFLHSDTSPIMKKMIGILLTKKSVVSCLTLCEIRSIIENDQIDLNGLSASKYISKLPGIRKKLIDMKTFVCGINKSFRQTKRPRIVDYDVDVSTMFKRTKI